MANETRKKRKTAEPDEHQAKRSRATGSGTDSTEEVTAGKVSRIFVKNFMCHDSLEIELNQNVNFIVGRNGSGKSAILTALVVGLGAKANATNRGSSVKEFIKKGRNSAVVEITLVNKGVMAYKPDVYGDFITVIRTIGPSAGYKIKNSNGEIISTKKDELERIISEMNIQVENPISILNQDVSRTFLVTSGPKEKYELFMKASHLDKIGCNYRNAQILSQEAKQRLIESKQHLSTAKKEIDDLEKNVRMLESIEGVRAEHNNLNNELHWSIAIAEEEKLNKIQTNLEEGQNEITCYKEEMSTKEEEEKLIQVKIAELRLKIQEIRNEATGSSEAYDKARKNLACKKEEHSSKYRDWRATHSKIKRMEADIAALRKEIQRQEADNNEVENEKYRVKAKLAKLEEQLVEIQAMLVTKQTDQMHLESNKSHLTQEEHILKVELDQNERRSRQKKAQLNGLKQESDNAVTIFGQHMPRLLKRIKEEYNRGKFKEMPRGPLGLHMKMKDPAWAPAVENFFNAGLLRTFCVDNTQDAKTLSCIMNEVFVDDNIPQIVASKFYHKVHDVSRHCTLAPGYYNLLEAMEISDPIVANCLIDQREVECVLLIPTSSEACEMLSNAQNVPRNCKKAVTQQGDLFFPDPNYRSYGGKRGLKARFLQVSTKEAIKVLEEELNSTEKERTGIYNKLKQVQQKLKQAEVDLTKVNEQVSKLRMSQRKIKDAINELRDKCEVVDSNSLTVFTSELNELLKKVEHDSVEETQLKEEVTQLQTEVESFELEVKRCQKLTSCLDFKLEPIKKLISEQENQMQTVQLRFEYCKKKLLEAEKVLQKTTADLEIQQRVTNKAVVDASKRCDRINTKRSANRIHQLMEELLSNIETIEQQWGSKDEIVSQLDKKKKKYDEIIEFANEIEISNDEQLKRLEGRRRVYHLMKKHIGIKVQHSFKSILALRKYTGNLTIDHNNRLLTLEVNPSGNVKRTTNDAKSLSGGERSYSTVAFILALWDCIQLPFYFLDEFDVFMDKVNRRVIMDILLDHARSHPANQFAFLTPLDTSNISASDYIRIHQLAPPERTQGSQ